MRRQTQTKRLKRRRRKQRSDLSYEREQRLKKKRALEEAQNFHAAPQNQSDKRKEKI